MHSMTKKNSLDCFTYRAKITHEGDRTLASFPDCPGCQTFADADEDIGAAAAEALEVWLESHLAHGETPPTPKSKTGLSVCVTLNSMTKKNTMTKKNSLDCFTDAELQVELDARAEKAKAKARAEAKAKAEARLAKFLKKLSMDWIDILAPEHTMTWCSDDDPINAFEVYCTGLRRCRRCALIEVSSGRYTNEDAEAFLQSIGFF